MADGSFDPVWEQIFSTQEWGKYPSEHVIRFVARNFYRAPDRRAVRLLDLGSGPGACTWYMAREGFSVSSIDGSASAIQRLGQRLAADGLASDARVGDFNTLPWGAATFDGVVDNQALCCNPYENARKVVLEVQRVLKPGGLFQSAHFTDRCWGYGIGRQVEPGGFTDVTEGPLAGRGFVRFMGRAQLEALYAGFESLEVETLAWTEGGHPIESWIVTARKAR